MPLTSGIFTIKNIKYHNWVTLPNENNDCELVSGCNIGTNAPLVTAEKVWVQSMLIDARLNSSISLQWKIEELGNGTYAIRNHYYNSSYAHCVYEGEHVINVNVKHSHGRVPAQWYIESESNDRYKYGANDRTS